MNLFKSKTNKRKDIEDVKKNMTKKEIINSKDGQYLIIIKEPMGSSSKIVGTFGADRFVDEQGAVWLKNEKFFFKERFPSEDKEYKFYNKEELDRRIKEREELLIKERDQDIENVNVKNLNKEIKKLKKFYDSLNLDGKGSFINFDESGRPYFTFIRYESLKFPVFENLDFTLFNVPSATRIKKCSELIQDRREKYSKHQKMNILASGVMLIILILAVGGGMFFFYKGYNKFTESGAVELQERIDELPIYCAEMYAKAGENFYKASENALNFSQSIGKNSNSPDIIINQKETKD